MNKITLVASVVLGIINPILAAEIYVDSASSAQSPDGSVDSPYKTIAAAVTAANLLTDEASTVYVKGNHLIDDEDDLVTVTATGMTIRAWGDVKPFVEISGDLSKNSDIESPKVFTIDLPAHNCTVKNIAFRYYSVNAQEKAGNSLGKGGRLFSIYANDCTVSGCEFTREGSRGANWGGNGVIYNESIQDTKNMYGTNMVVSSCIFNNLGYNGKCIVRTYSKNKIVGNIFQNCAGYYMYAIKTSAGGYFVSNRVVNCSSPIYTTYENWGEIPDAEIAYNIFVASDIPFILRNGSGRGMTGRPKIHHNTVVGCSSLIRVESVYATDGTKADKAWAPLVFDNLIVSGDGSSVIREEENNSIGVISTSFVKEKTYEPRITGNVYFTTSFSDGSAVYLEGYDLYGGGLVCENNTALAMAPEFLNTTDVTSEDYYCLNSSRYPWVLEANGAEGFASEYIGAVPPKAIEAEEGEYFQVDSFTVNYESLFAPVSATFSVGYSQNAGEVEVFWDFDGDGEVDQSGRQTSVTYVYAKPGDYSPIVRIRDKKTNKEVGAILNSGVLQIRLKDVYVDSGAQINGNGSNENPFKTIREGVDACGIGGTVHIKGGEDRVYEILTEDDLIVVDRPNIKIKSWGDYGNPQFIISHELSKAVENPCVVSIDAEATDVIISDLNFVWYGNLNETYPGSSIGAGGRIISTSAERTLIKNCNFRIEGASKFSGIVNNAFAVACAIGDNNTSPGEGLRVEGCMFEGLTGDERQMNAILCGRNVEVVQNVFTNCNKAFTYCKNTHNNYIGVVSNVFFECAKVPGASPWGPWNYTQNADISYNIFVTSTGEPFITKGNTGLNGNVSIHHNTVVGASEFMEISVSTDALRPQIRDNLIILNEGGVVIDDKSTAIPEGMTSAFKSETSFSNNVYLASAFSGGTATELAGYRMNVEPVNCTVLSAAPSFISTDPSSPDFMRVKSK